MLNKWNIPFVLDTKYGGSSPKAVPKPHKKLSKATNYTN